MSEMCPIDGLNEKSCQPCEGGVAPLTEPEIAEQLKSLVGWEFVDGSIVKVYQFKNYYQTLAFTNAVAWIAHREDHHPELVINYRTCEVRYDTHAIGGISENDFICAAKIDQLQPAKSA